MNLLSKDQELNFSGKVEDEDELDMKAPSDPKTIADLEEGLQMEDDTGKIKGGKNQEEQKEFFHQQDKGQTLGKKINLGRNKIQEEQTNEPMINNQMEGKSPLKNKQPM